MDNSCTSTSQTAYGEGMYGTCSFIGAPNTGFFGEIIQDGTWMILLPLAIAVVTVVASTIYGAIRKRRQAHITVSNDQA